MYFHNLSKYDSHLFVKKLRGDISCIPHNEENYISFSTNIVVDEYINKKGEKVEVKRELRFLDTFKFMNTSLDKLVKNLQEDECINLHKFYKGGLLKRKGVYPYQYIDSVAKFDETCLPPKDKFYSKLTDSDITDEDYEHAKNVWNAFKIKNLKEYHELYNKTDVLLLADVFEKFRKVCLKHYELDPAWYYTSPGLSWDAMLKITKVDLELLSDPDMKLMFQQGKRGGISSVMHRYAKANNKYMKNFDKNKPHSYISYLDCNNLYGYVESMNLPTHGFEWMNENELHDWENHPCFLEVDLKYSSDLHDKHNSFPLAPEIINVGGVDKLIPNLNDKTKYVVHYKTLKFYESKGLQITKIHRGIKFIESSFMKEYVDLNTKLRTEAKNSFERDFFKLMNNCLYGKSLEDIESRIDFKLITDKEKAIKLGAKPYYDRTVIFDENLIGMHMKKTKLYFDKPIYLGMSILDLSKEVMYDFHYNYIIDKYGDNAKLLYTDTDSLMYHIFTEDFYKDISEDIDDRFDTSDYPENHPSGIKTGVNKKVAGKFKDEAGGKQIEEFVGLRPKLYSFIIDGENIKKCKGIKKNIVDKGMKHNDYKKCLFTGEEQYRKMNIIRSHQHEICSEEINKKTLSANDDKRIILADGITTVALGHNKFEENLNFAIHPAL